MIIGLSLQHFTILHVAISVIGIASGVVVLIGMLGANPRPGWTAVFLVSTALTTATGFLFPIKGPTPALVTGLVSTPLLALALYAVYGRKLGGVWRWIYVVAGVAAFYLNVVALIAQAFLKVPGLHALAPTGSEPAFLAAQGAGLILFVVLGAMAVTRFRPGPRRIAIT